MYYTYVLQSEKDDKFYTGFTKDLKLRFDRHHKELVKSTKDRRPLRLIYYEACLSQDDAVKREKYLKEKTYSDPQFLIFPIFQRKEGGIKHEISKIEKKIKV